MTSQQRIEGRRIGIVGMARSGLAAACLAQKLGGQPFVSDSKATSELSDATAVLAGHRIPFETAGHSKRLLECDYLVVSPGVPPTIEILQRAGECGIPLFSEIEFASWICRGTIVAVTGSNGKTTTVTLLGEMFKAAGRITFVCGNIGQPFAEVAADVPADENMGLCGHPVVSEATDKAVLNCRPPQEARVPAAVNGHRHSATIEIQGRLEQRQCHGRPGSDLGRLAKAHDGPAEL